MIEIEVEEVPAKHLQAMEEGRQAIIKPLKRNEREGATITIAPDKSMKLMGEEKELERPRILIIIPAWCTSNGLLRRAQSFARWRSSSTKIQIYLLMFVSEYPMVMWLIRQVSPLFKTVRMRRKRVRIDKTPAC